MSALPQPLPPLPVQPIAYSTPVANRPGLITAIGVLSIVVGSLGLLFNGIAGLQAAVMVMVSQASQAAATAQQARTAAAAATAPPTVVDPLSMPADDRQTVLRGLAMHRAISQPRRDQLDALLLRCGRRIFALGGADLTVTVVRENVNESGRLPDAKGGEGPDFFIIGTGRIELADDYAKFSPEDGGEVVRVNAFDSGEQPNWEAGLTPAQVKAILDDVKKRAGATVPAAQVSKLEAILSSPTQEYFDPVPTIKAATAQIQSVGYANTVGAPAGTGVQLTLTTQNGHIMLDGSGKTISAMTWNANAAGFGGANPFSNVNMSAAAVALVCAGLSLLLAIYLLVIGILVLRQHPRGARLHRIYAWVKIPVAIAGGVAWVMLWTSFIRSAAPAGTAGAVTPTIITWSVVAVVVGCLYPVGLLIALRTRGVREYYATVS